MAGDQASAALIGQVRPQPLDRDHHPTAEPDQEINMGTAQISQATRPLKRSQPKSTTAALRPMVARLPKSR
jgi:hypothetical protein